MNKLTTALVFGGVMAFYAGCGIIPAERGALYTETNAPLAVGAAGSASKEGTSLCTNVLGLVATGDCSVEAAAKQGHISQIRSVDRKTYSILGLYTTATTIVRGN